MTARFPRGKHPELYWDRKMIWSNLDSTGTRYMCSSTGVLYRCRHTGTLFRCTQSRVCYTKCTHVCYLIGIQGVHKYAVQGVCNHVLNNESWKGWHWHVLVFCAVELKETVWPLHCVLFDLSTVYCLTSTVYCLTSTCPEEGILIPHWDNRSGLLDLKAIN